MGSETSLCTVSQKAALAGLALLIWQVVNSELSRLLEKEPGDKMHEKYAARFGTYASTRRRPTGARSTKSEASNEREEALTEQLTSPPLPLVFEETRYGDGLSLSTWWCVST